MGKGREGGGEWRTEAEWREIHTVLLLDTHVHMHAHTHQMVQEGGLNKHTPIGRQTPLCALSLNECLLGVRGSKLI